MMSIFRQPSVLVAAALLMLAPPGCEQRRDDANREPSRDNTPMNRGPLPSGSVTAGGSASSQSPANRGDDGTRRSGVLDSPGGARTTSEPGSPPRDGEPPLQQPDGKVPAKDEPANKTDERTHKTGEPTNKTGEPTHKTDDRTDRPEDRSGKSAPKPGEPPRGSNPPPPPTPPSGSR